MAREIGNITFHFPHKPEWEGEPQESEEMRPKWFSTENIPLNNIWSSDTHWLLKALQSNRVQGTIFFNEQSEVMKADLVFEPRER